MTAHFGSRLSLSHWVDFQELWAASYLCQARRTLVMSLALGVGFVFGEGGCSCGLGLVGCGLVGPGSQDRGWRVVALGVVFDPHQSRGCVGLFVVDAAKDGGLDEVDVLGFLVIPAPNFDTTFTCGTSRN